MNIKLMRKNDKIICFLEYILAILTILNCNSVYFTYFNSIKLIVNVSWQLVLLLLVIYTYSKFNSENITRLFLFSSILIIYDFILLTARPSFLGNHWIFGMLIDPILLIMYFINNNNINTSFFVRFENVVIIISIISLVLWGASLIGLKPDISLPGRSIYSPNVNGYFGLYFASQGIRNTGIFTESPMYSYILCMALFVDLFIKHNKDIFNKKSIWLILTIMSSMSTTGIAIVILSLFYKEVISSSESYKKLLLILIVLIIPFIIEILLYNKRGNVNDLHSSYSIRMNDISSSIRAWKQHILFGNGFNNYDSIEQYMYSFRLLPGANVGLSTGLFTVLAFGGFFYALFYIIPVVISLFKCSYNIKGLAILSFILFIYTIIPNTQLCIIILSYLMALNIYNIKRYKVKKYKFNKIYLRHS